MIGSAPLPPVPRPQLEVIARCTATMLTEAMASSNAGMRAYCFGLALLAWFIQPWLFIAVTTWMLGVLLARQLRSRSFRAVERQLGLLAAARGSPPREG
jgi:uncharacterized membrane protein